MEATHKISAVYFPGTREVELSWEEIETGKTISITAKITHEHGCKIAEIIPPCVYSGAILKGE